MFKAFGFLILFGFWLLLSGKFDLFHLSLGVISCLIVSTWTDDLLFQNRGKNPLSRLGQLPQFISYVFWLTIQVVKANLSVIYLALHPGMKHRLSPQIIRFKTTLTGDFARVVLANSITLTPGTITVRIEGDEFVVHAISEEIAAGTPGEMEDRIVRWLGNSD